MSCSCCSRSIPRARVTPIDSFSEALWLMLSTHDSGPAAETIVYLLDDHRCGLSILHAYHRDSEAVVSVVDDVAEAAAADPEVAAMIIGTVRPDGGAELADHARWGQIAELCDDAGIELVEWIVLGNNGVTCPREVGGEPARWMSC